MNDINWQLDEDEELVMQVFGRHPHRCIHQLHSMTEIPYPELKNVVDRLQRKAKIFKIPDAELGKHDLQYRIRQTEPTLQPSQFCNDARLSPLIGLNEVQMQGRMVMLKRMRRLLIPEWHPILDTIIGDYERDLKRMKLLREPEDDVEGGIDVLDRDME